MFNNIYLQADCTNASIASKRSLRTGINVIHGETANKPSLVPDFCLSLSLTQGAFLRSKSTRPRLNRDHAHRRKGQFQ